MILAKNNHLRFFSVSHVLWSEASPIAMCSHGALCRAMHPIKSLSHFNGPFFESYHHVISGLKGNSVRQYRLSRYDGPLPCYHRQQNRYGPQIILGQLFSVRIVITVSATPRSSQCYTYSARWNSQKLMNAVTDGSCISQSRWNQLNITDAEVGPF